MYKWPPQINSIDLFIFLPKVNLIFFFPQNKYFLIEREFNWDKLQHNLDFLMTSALLYSQYNGYQINSGWINI